MVTNVVNTFFFPGSEDIAPFFIKKSELQVSYKRTFIAQITNHKDSNE